MILKDETIENEYLYNLVEYSLESTAAPKQWKH